MNPSKLITLTGIFSAGIFSSCTQNPVLNTPNIIFIMSDDHAFQAVSAYQDRFKDVAPTPNIDRIAQQGMRFDRCLVTNSISGPSRAAILTGKYSHLNGFTTNVGRDMQFDGSQQTFPKLLQQAGYQTAMIGKWHLGSDPTGFDHWDILPGQGNYYNPDFMNSEGRYREEGYVSDIITDKSLEWIKEAQSKQKPFMLMLHHKAPHRAWEPGPKYLRYFEGVAFPEPVTLFDDYSGRGRAAYEQDMSIEKTMRIDFDLKMWFDSVGNFHKRLTEEQLQDWNEVYQPIMKDFTERNPQGKDLVRWKYQRYMNDYLACIQSVDENVGRVLDYLKESGLDKNTIVVYTSDQGFYLGEHGWFDKRFMYEESYRTPLLISWPGVTEPGSINKDIVSNLDFAQTFLNIAGAEIPEDMQGASIVPLLKGDTPDNWRTAHYYHYYEYPFGHHSVKRHYGISTARYKLIHFYHDIDEWELYDLEKDSMEMQNVYEDPSYLTVREKLHKELSALREKYKDSDEVTRSFLPLE